MRYAVGLGVLLGLAALFAFSRSRSLPSSTDTEGPVSLAELERLTQAQTDGRVEITEAGLSLETSPELKVVKVDAGVNRIVRVLKDQKPVLIANSAPVYPWMDLEGVKLAVRGSWKEWKTGTVEEAGLPSVSWSGRWAYELQPERRLVLVGEGRVITISGPSWEDPAFAEVLGSMRSVKGGDYRSAYVSVHRAPADAAGKPVPEELKSHIDRAIAQLEPVIDAPPPSFVQGVAAWRAGKMDLLDAAIFGDLLYPYLRDLEMAMLSDQMKAEFEGQGCPSMATPPEAPAEGQASGHGDGQAGH